MSHRILRSQFFLLHLFPFFPAHHNRPEYHDSHTPVQPLHHHQPSRHCMVEVVPIFARLFYLLSVLAHPTLLCMVLSPATPALLFSALETAHGIQRSPFDSPMNEKDSPYNPHL